MRRYKNILAAIIFVGVMFFGTAARAGTVLPALGGTVVISENSTPVASWNLNSAAYTDNGDGTFTYQGVNGNQTVWAFEWDILVNPDPFISATFSITNNTASTKHFNLLFTLPVGSPFTSGLMSGDLDATFRDLNNSGSATLGNFDWSGMIDGSPVMSLVSGTFTCGGTGCTGNIFPISDGPNPSAGVNTSIGINMVFDLTAGDKATFNTSFEVVPVPLPAAIWLFGAGLGLLSVFARRNDELHLP